MWTPILILWRGNEKVALTSSRLVSKSTWKTMSIKATSKWAFLKNLWSSILDLWFIQKKWCVSIPRTRRKSPKWSKFTTTSTSSVLRDFKSWSTTKPWSSSSPTTYNKMNSTESRRMIPWISTEKPIKKPAQSWLTKANTAIRSKPYSKVVHLKPFPKTLSSVPPLPRTWN